ncbi:maleylpyruvate isomerase [Blastococcus colisei]|uniref:Maleylpyruvate isomerase n=1 Tax=Blastococcus colisei TaxID=1564162 RepID=A0A543PDX6_9ACTN|nr:maleylpyruvate isomerase family mycothiol-dependent enzyme [Blastococcus colisei]TQN42275.1 maleylpyruvate isomerase [Blastococcus colisei]
MSAPGTLGWWEHGEAFFATALDRLPEPDLDGPSLLPGWPRRTVVAHVARNADALVNLLTWARTGEATPMYASAAARDAAIAETASLPAADLVADCRAAGRRLATAVRGMPEEAWTAEVRTAQGRTVTASEVPWMRCREVWVHAVDLDAGLGFGHVPDDVLTELIDDVTRTWQRRDQTPGVRFTTGTRDWGAGPATATGDLADVAAWVTGRRSLARSTADRDSPLPTWL